MRCDAAIVFAKGLSGEWQRTESVALVSAIARVDPETAIDDWLEHEESSHDRTTIATWRQYGQRWLTFFGTDLRAINVRTLSKFMSERLRHVLAKTVRKELSALRSPWPSLMGRRTRSGKTDAPQMRCWLPFRGGRWGHYPYRPNGVDCALSLTSLVSVGFVSGLLRCEGGDLNPYRCYPTGT
jgi:hypothetical protein